MITFNDLELIHEEIYPNIVVYKNLIRDVDAIGDSLKFSSLVTGEEKPGILPIWGRWFGFGTYVSVSGDALSQDKQDADLDDSNSLYERERRAIHAAYNARLAAICHYMGKYDMGGGKYPEDVKTYIQPSINFAKYDPDIKGLGAMGEEEPELTMQYHTDFHLDKILRPCENFMLTCNIYWNDDYDGGEVTFLVHGKVVDYKPVAGDVVVFPSGSYLFPGDEPYFHGVRTVKNGNKFISRNYLMYSQPASQNWIDGVAKHGEEEWLKMEKERQAKDRIAPNVVVLDYHNPPPGKDFDLLYNPVVKEYYWKKDKN